MMGTISKYWTLATIGTAACIILSGCASSAPEAHFVPVAEIQTVGSADYLLDRGDVINVNFPEIPALNDSVLVRADGKVSLVYIHDITAAGRSLEQFRNDVLTAYVRLGVLNTAKPELDLSLKSSAGTQVYVGGEVTSPGMFPLNGHGTLSQYLTQAGGIKNTAAISKVVLIRRDQDFRPVYSLIDASNIFTGGAANADIALHPFDVVYVPKNLGGRLDGLADVYIKNLIPVNFTASYLLP